MSIISPLAAFGKSSVKAASKAVVKMGKSYKQGFSEASGASRKAFQAAGGFDGGAKAMLKGYAGTFKGGKARFHAPNAAAGAAYGYATSRKKKK